MNSVFYGSELYHHGIKGQHWGVRRYQNYDGTRTPAGIRRRRALEDMSELTDQEVQNKLNRARNELQYHKTLQELDDFRSGRSDMSNKLNDARNELQYRQTMRQLENDRIGKAESRERVQQAVKDIATVAAVTGSIVLIGTNGSKIVKAVMKTIKDNPVK